MKSNLSKEKKIDSHQLAIIKITLILSFISSLIVGVLVFAKPIFMTYRYCLGNSYEPFIDFLPQARDLAISNNTIENIQKFRIKFLRETGLEWALVENESEKMFILYYQKNMLNGYYENLNKKLKVGIPSKCFYKENFKWCIPIEYLEQEIWNDLMKNSSKWQLLKNVWTYSLH